MAQSKGDCSFIIPRSAWNASAPIRSDPLTLPISNAVFIHTAGRQCASFAACALIVQIIQAQHFREDNFDDIAYNFLIGGDGSVFEGRGWFKKGAFRVQYNSIGYGTAFLGSYEDATTAVPSSAAIQAAKRLLECGRSNGYLRQNYTLRSVYIKESILKLLDLPDHMPETGNTPALPLPKTKPFPMLETGLAIGALALFILAFVSVLLVFKKRMTQKSAHLIKTARASLPPGVLPHYQIARVGVSLTKTILGYGIKGIVLKGHLLSSTSDSNAPAERIVAVKMLRYGHSVKGDVEEFLREMSTLAKIGRHVNVVRLIGIVLEGELMLIMEHCTLGSLKSYLVETKKAATLAGSPDIQELTVFTHQISRGMEFIASRNIIHRDLSARNILLDERKIAKVADFGMAREQTSYTLMRDKVELPLKWMAPESLTSGIYSTHTDVWSFAILAWEIFSLGDVPFQTVFGTSEPSHLQLLDFLQTGRRLEKPSLCPEEMYKIMLQCWEFKPNGRPSFSQIKDRIATQLPEGFQEHYVVFDAQNKLFNATLDQSSSNG